MSDDGSFSQLVQRVRNGDEQAAFELVRDYESVIRREVRLQLYDPRLRRLFDSMDICQSVLASFFARAAAGEYELDHPAQLVKLLATMTKRKLASEARRQARKRRDHRRAAAGGDEQLGGIAGDEETPSQQVSNRELVDKARETLTEEENRIAELRNDGLSWEEIAEQLGGSAQARRMQLVRAMERLGKTFGLSDDSP